MGCKGAYTSVASSLKPESLFIHTNMPYFPYFQTHTPCNFPFSPCESSVPPPPTFLLGSTPPPPQHPHVGSRRIFFFITLCDMFVGINEAGALMTNSNFFYCLSSFQMIKLNPATIFVLWLHRESRWVWWSFRAINSTYSNLFC